MSKEEMTEYRRKLGEFFYPFLGNVELGNISAVENTNLLIDAFIVFNEAGYFINRPSGEILEKAPTKEAEKTTREDDESLMKFANALGLIYRLE